jgi:tRNA (guanine37-N1)-methyltransferase
MSNTKTHHIWIITLFPELFSPFFNSGVAGATFSSKRKGQFQVHLVQMREYGLGKHKSVDDAPFGGGPGMVIRADVLQAALLKGVVEAGGYGENFREKLHVVYTSPRGESLSSDLCRHFAQTHWSSSEPNHDLVFICGRYEGVDERFLTAYVNQEISLGDFVLTGGELAVMAILDAAIRMVPGSLGNADSAASDSFYHEQLLEHPQYTRPAKFEEQEVPPILLSGNHAMIEEYRGQERERITATYRPDLLHSKKIRERR